MYRRVLAVVVFAFVAGGALLYAVRAQTPASSSPCIPDECGYVEGAQFVIAPVEDASRACGLTREYKVVGRMDPPTKTKTSGENTSWQINGCYYFHNTELRQVVLALAFDSEPRVVVVPLADLVAPDTRESKFSVVVARPNGDPIRGAYLASQWRAKR
jgi:zona occludens toxin (predicted ATPase)